jgi:hypothetical protein
MAAISTSGSGVPAVRGGFTSQERRSSPEWHDRPGRQWLCLAACYRQAAATACRRQWHFQPDDLSDR